jgi:hypothetical protein
MSLPLINFFNKKIFSIVTNNNVHSPLSTYYATSMIYQGLQLVANMLSTILNLEENTIGSEASITANTNKIIFRT